ncbi:MAG TPA: carbonic anhydrase [Thermoanaerobaculia bacterium]|nr:carbonic anhydrase [Thermoanaerobaculia bacterium]
MRRIALACCGLLLCGLPLLAAPPAAADCPLPATPPITPTQLWEEVVAGNAVFVDGDVHYAGLRALRRGMRDWQAPPIAALSCADSRVMPEVAFERTIGELFVTRVAGNIADDYSVASLDYAVLNGWTPLIVVMGHSDCGAVKAALEPDPVPPQPPPTPALGVLLGKIRDGLKAAGIPRNPKPTPAQLRQAIEANTRYAANELTEDSPLLKRCVEAGRLKIVAAYYDVGTGKVELLQR